MKIEKENINEAIKHLSGRTMSEIEAFTPKNFLNLYSEASKNFLNTNVNWQEIEYFGEYCFRIYRLRLPNGRDVYHLKINFNDNNGQFYAQAFNFHFDTFPLQRISNINDIKTIIKFYDKFHKLKYKIYGKRKKK